MRGVNTVRITRISVREALRESYDFAADAYQFSLKMLSVVCDLEEGWGREICDCISLMERGEQIIPIPNPLASYHIPPTSMLTVAMHLERVSEGRYHITQHSPLTVWLERT